MKCVILSLLLFTQHVIFSQPEIQWVNEYSAINIGGRFG